MKPLKHISIITALLFSLGSLAQTRNVQLQIEPSIAGQKLLLGKSFVIPQGDTVEIEKFRFYISSVSLKLEDGTVYTDKDSYYLVDLEDAASQQIELKNVPAGKILAINFNIGVDSVASVSGALAGALDPMKGMYWAWNSGYINAKLEGTCITKIKKHHFEFHVGGYLKPNYALRHVTLETITSENFIVLHADANAWLNGENLRKENSVVIPGPEAMRVADKYTKMFDNVKP